MDHVANGHTFTIPSQLGKPAMPTDFKAFADSMPPGRVEITTANTVTDMVGFHKSRVVYFSDGGEYRVNDSVPVGGQVCVASRRGFVSVMGGTVEPASERLIPPNGLVVLTRVAAGLWLIAKGSGGAGSYFNNAIGGDAVGTFTVDASLLAADPLLEEVGAVWKWHHFTTSRDFTVLESQQPFRYVLVSGGGGGGSSGTTGAGKPGTGGRIAAGDALTLTVGTYTVTLGAGGAGNTGNTNNSIAGADSTVADGGGVVLTTAGKATGKRNVHLTGQVGPWGVGGAGGGGGGCASSFGQRAGCGGVGDQDYGGGKANCGCASNPCTDCGGGCINCQSGHGVWHGHGGGGGGGGACCNGGAAAGGRGGFIVAYRVGEMMRSQPSADYIDSFTEELPDIDVSVDFDDDIAAVFDAHE